MTTTDSGRPDRPPTGSHCPGPTDGPDQYSRSCLTCGKDVLAYTDTDPAYLQRRHDECLIWEVLETIPQAELADLLGVSVSTIFRWESNTIPDTKRTWLHRWLNTPTTGQAALRAWASLTPKGTP